MSFEIPGFSFTLPAEDDQSATQFRFVDATSTGTVKNVSSAGGRAIGVRQNKPKAGHAATIVGSGISKVEAGGTVTAGGNVTSDSQGRVVDAVATNKILGVALEGTTSSGVVVAVLLNTSHATVPST